MNLRRTFWLTLALSVCAATAFGQGAAPETAPPLFREVDLSRTTRFSRHEVLCREHHQTWTIPRDQPSCLSAVTSASESHSSFECVFSSERRNDERASRTTATSRKRACACIASANQTHRDARPRHDLKLLSIRCEATPRTPVWRSKRGSQFDRWKGRDYAKRGRTD